LLLRYNCVVAAVGSDCAAPLAHRQCCPYFAREFGHLPALTGTSDSRCRRLLQRSAAGPSPAITIIIVAPRTSRRSSKYSRRLWRHIFPFPPSQFIRRGRSPPDHRKADSHGCDWLPSVPLKQFCRHWGYLSPSRSRLSIVITPITIFPPSTLH